MGMKYIDLNKTLGKAATGSLGGRDACAEPTLVKHQHGQAQLNIALPMADSLSDHLFLRYSL